jgi:hypothetical protein
VVDALQVPLTDLVRSHEEQRFDLTGPSALRLLNVVAHSDQTHQIRVTRSARVAGGDERNAHEEAGQVISWACASR